jgi:hypothetical protein
MIAVVLLTIGSAITIGFGVWHLFVPDIWSWYSYFPEGARELVVAVRAINVFFSVSLIIFGAVMLVFVYRKPTSTFHVRSIAVALSVLWAVRVLLQVIWPQGSMAPALQYGLLITFILVFAAFLLSSFLIRET